jgi:hypothetical protein
MALSHMKLPIECSCVCVGFVWFSRQRDMSLNNMNPLIVVLDIWHVVSDVRIDLQNII